MPLRFEVGPTYLGPMASASLDQLAWGSPDGDEGTGAVVASCHSLDADPGTSAPRTVMFPDPPTLERGKTYYASLKVRPLPPPRPHTKSKGSESADVAYRPPAARVR